MPIYDPVKQLELIVKNLTDAFHTDKSLIHPFTGEEVDRSELIDMRKSNAIKYDLKKHVFNTPINNTFISGAYLNKHQSQVSITLYFRNDFPKYILINAFTNSSTGGVGVYKVEKEPNLKFKAPCAGGTWFGKFDYSGDKRAMIIYESHKDAVMEVLADSYEGIYESIFQRELALVRNLINTEKYNIIDFPRDDQVWVTDRETEEVVNLQFINSEIDEEEFKNIIKEFCKETESNQFICPIFLDQNSPGAGRGNRYLSDGERIIAENPVNNVGEQEFQVLNLFSLSPENAHQDEFGRYTLPRSTIINDRESYQIKKGTSFSQTDLTLRNRNLDFHTYESGPWRLAVLSPKQS